MNPIAYFPLETPAFENVRTTEENVRTTRELIIERINFWELGKKERKAVKHNWDMKMIDKVETRRYKRPYVHKKLPAAMSSSRLT